MHIVMVVVFGLVSLGIFAAAATVINKSGRSVDGARAFIWVWLVAAILNGAFGVLYADIPILNEVAAFIPIFGIPAAIAWYLSRRFSSRSDSELS
jgi:hypothetical protein